MGLLRRRVGLQGDCNVGEGRSRILPRRQLPAKVGISTGSVVVVVVVVVILGWGEWMLKRKDVREAVGDRPRGSCLLVGGEEERLETASLQ